MSKLFSSIGGVIVLLAVLFFLGSRNTGPIPQGERSAAASILSAAEDSFDFGEISMRDGSVRRIFTVQNSSSTTPLAIRDISTSCMCTTAYLNGPSGTLGPFGMPGGHGGGNTAVSEVIPAGESREIEVVFDPAAHGPAGVGRIERAVFIEDENGEVQTLKISATVTP